MYLNHVRGHLKPVGKQWHYSVSIGDVVVFRDDCRPYEKALALCLADVEAARRVVAAGHTFMKSYDQLVREARI